MFPLCEFSCFQLLLSIPDMINLLWYIYYSQISTRPRHLNLMIHFSQKLMSTRIFPILSGIIPDEKPFSSFLSLSCFSIIPDNNITSILVSLINLLSYLSFSNNWGSLLLISSKKFFYLRDSFLLILESWMSPMLCMAVLCVAKS